MFAISHEHQYNSILVLNALNGILPLALREAFPGAKIVCGEAFPFFEAHLKGLGFEALPYQTIDMKFDLVIGNPPYQLTTSKKLWPDFVQFALDHVQPGGYVNLIVPSTWLESNGSAYKNIRTRLTTQHNLLSVSRDANQHFSVGQDICVFLSRAEAYQHRTQYTENGKTIEIDLVKGLPKPEERVAIERVINKILSFDPKIQWKLNDKLSRVKSSDISAVQTSTHQYPVWQSTANFGYVSQPLPDHGKLKLAVNFSSSFYSSKSSHNNMPITQDGVGSLMGYVLINSEQEGLQLRSYLTSRAIRFLVSNYKKSHTGFSDAVKRSVIPAVPNKMWTDTEVYEYFDLSESDVMLIESLVK